MSRKIGICPRCGKTDYLDALSRYDNETSICSSCGTDEALREIMCDELPIEKWYKNRGDVIGSED